MQVMDPVSITLFSDLQVVAYVKMACLALLTFDTIIAFEMEYTYIWRRRWTFVKVLYLYSRYSAFIDTIIAVYERIDPHFSTCAQIMTFTTIFAGFGIGMTDLILMIRTYAIYGSSRRMLIFFLIMWLAIGGCNFWAVTRWTGSFDISENDNIPETISAVGCHLQETSKIGLVCYISLLVGETVIVCMTAIKAFSTWWFAQKANFTSSNLIKSFYRDGILFYFFILPFTVLNVLALFVFPPGLLLIADTPLRVMHTVLACRMVLRVRRVADEETDSNTEKISAIEFRNGPVEDSINSHDREIV